MVRSIQWSEVSNGQKCSTHGKDTQRQCSAVVTEDDKAVQVERVLLMATTVSFCCLMMLAVSSLAVTVCHHRRSRACHRQFSEHGPSNSSACRWKVAIGVFLMLRAIYSLTITFTGALATYQLVVGVIFVSRPADDMVSALMTITDRLHSRLADLERLEGLSWLEGQDYSLRRLHSSLEACDQYVDNMLSNITLVRISQRRRPTRNSCAFDRIQRVRRKFLHAMPEYVQSQKIQLDAAVADWATRDVRLNGLLDSAWLSYPRSLFHMAHSLPVDNSSNNRSTISVRSTKFASFLEADDALNAIQRWTAVVHKR